ncbi:peroxidase [Manduca sexta]|uniref:Peroxidase-like n=1 Tax=Manduca sexta TaxID=7130 RepID=A0A921ZHL2_MANSE|nr:peroxidase [Manduca sexta]KAG6457890.1 hypothetical protein O3G_MSEX010554 [Manduca sexta]
MWYTFYFFNFLYCINALTYHSYYGVPVSEEEVAKYKANNKDAICVVTFEPCDENEWRRVDGSCNNLDYPSHGTMNTPELRLLPAYYSEGFGLRKTKSGKEFPLTRSVRLHLLKVGDGIDDKFATSASYFIEFFTADIVAIHDIENYVLINTNCCEPEGLNNPSCAPNFLPVNDNVHRFSGMNCNNMTKPLTFQTEGCVPTNTLPNRITKSTTHMDLSMTYVHANASAIHDHRTNEGGKLKVEVVNGIALPSDAVEGTTCLIKQARETGCTRNVPNTILGTHLFSTWFWRFHNYAADGLAAVNPCWDDDTLFHAAMDINIAYYTRMMMYEFYGEVLGKENLIKEGVLNSHDGFRDVYDKTVLPGVFAEYGYSIRWFHETQDGTQELYDKYHNFMGTTQTVNFSLRVQDLAYDENLRRLTQGVFLQPAGGFGDGTIHPDMADFGLGPLQKTLDILSNDLAKGRYFGLAPYIYYRDLCTNYEKKHETFEDLEYLMDKSQINLLKKVYEDPWDIELMAGIWSERLMEGAWVPPTVYCLIVQQLKRTVVSDRHWYERPNRPHAFTAEQLEQINRGSFAGLLCAVGDDVTHIQPKAFLRIGPGNEKVSCEEIPRIDFNMWKDDKCNLCE